MLVLLWLVLSERWICGRGIALGQAQLQSCTEIIPTTRSSCTVLYPHLNMSRIRLSWSCAYPSYDFVCSQQTLQIFELLVGDLLADNVSFSWTDSRTRWKFGAWDIFLALSICICFPPLCRLCNSVFEQYFFNAMDKLAKLHHSNVLSTDGLPRFRCVSR